jgi:magnesium-protoporphyrin IX monomethyl ester (oxidative) cyclase
MQFLYEVSPILSRETLKNLADSGVRWMQPGIEHLHNGALTALGKANRAHQNIRFLKWAREYGVFLFWNFMFFFPGEEEAWFADMAELIPLLVHLQPPMALPPLRYDRFSRYHAHPGQYGLSLQPYPAYAAVYPLATGELADLAYFFDDPERRVRLQGLYSRSPALHLLLERLGEWMWDFHKDRRSILGMRRTGPGTIHIEDTRPVARVRSMELSGIDAAVYELCDAGPTRAALAVRFREMGINPEKAEKAIANFIEAGIMIDVEGRPLSLAVTLPCREYVRPDVRPDGHWIRRKPPAPEMDPAAITAEQAYRIRL